MKIVFFGSSSFAVPLLKSLLKTKQEILCVVTQPDRQKGRGLHLESTAIKTLAAESGLTVYQPERINTSESIHFLKDLNPDLFIVISYGQILSEEIINIPHLFAVNAHASILPKYRGAAPINWSLINGDKTTGVTLMKIVKKMDAGPIILQKITDIEEVDTNITLEAKLSELAAELVLDLFKSIEDNNYKLIPQDELSATPAWKLKKEDGLINWNKSTQEICNLVRGVLTWPGAFTYYRGKILKIYTTRPYVYPNIPARSHPGEILDVLKEGLVVCSGKGALIIEELQIEGKRKMKVEEFIAGHKIRPGDSLG